VITAAAALASRPTYGGVNGYSPEQQAFGAGMQSLGGRAVGQLSQGLNVRPTITVQPGTLLRVLLNKPLTFSGAYHE
jgi:type IV secretory pathway VirB10-like protein